MTAPRSLDLCTKLVLVGVEERQVTLSFQCTRCVVQTFSKRDSLSASGNIWIPSSMTKQRVDLSDACTLWEWVLIHTKPNRVREIGALITEELEDVLVLRVIRDGLGSLQGVIGNVTIGGIRKDRISLCHKWWQTGGRRTCSTISTCILE